jgi:cyclic pyranopterin phosphate synthase
MSRLSHLDDEGRARMIDVGAKAVTRRVAVASGRFDTTAEVVALVLLDKQGLAEGLPKADVLATARIAGIAAAKRTSELIPLAHLLPLEKVTIEFEPAEASIGIVATVAVTAKTGVEMEALTAVAIAGLTLHDMVKAVDPAASLTDVHLVSKRGGKTRATGAPTRAVAIVSSTRAAAGQAEDRTGPLLVDWLRSRGYEIEAATVVSDADIARALQDAVAGSPGIVLTTGGTGISATDRTPEATGAVLERPLPGVAEAIRAAGRERVPTAALSRALAGLVGETLVVNLPGSPGAVRDGLAVLDEVLPHLREQLAGGDHG